MARVLAESSEAIPVEGNQYFPLSSVRHERLLDIGIYTTCPWKGGKLRKLRFSPVYSRGKAYPRYCNFL
ncbi:MAG: DUF427 domain-containing protein [Candidatus Binatia bacterium]